MVKFDLSPRTPQSGMLQLDHCALQFNVCGMCLKVQQLIGGLSVCVSMSSSLVFHLSAISRQNWSLKIFSTKVSIVLENTCIVCSIVPLIQCLR